MHGKRASYSFHLLQPIYVLLTCENFLQFKERLTTATRRRTRVASTAMCIHITIFSFDRDVGSCESKSRNEVKKGEATVTSHLAFFFSYSFFLIYSSIVNGKIVPVMFDNLPVAPLGTPINLMVHFVVLDRMRSKRFIHPLFNLTLTHLYPQDSLIILD